MNAPAELDELEQAVLACLAKHGLQTATALARRLRFVGGGRVTVKRALHRLQRLGFVEIERSGHQPRWQACAATGDEPPGPTPPGLPDAAEARFMADVRRKLGLA